MQPNEFLWSQHVAVHHAAGSGCTVASSHVENPFRELYSSGTARALLREVGVTPAVDAVASHSDTNHNAQRRCRGWFRSRLLFCGFPAIRGPIRVCIRVYMQAGRPEDRPGSSPDILVSTPLHRRRKDKVGQIMMIVNGNGRNCVCEAQMCCVCFGGEYLKRAKKKQCCGVVQTSSSSGGRVKCCEGGEKGWLRSKSSRP